MQTPRLWHSILDAHLFGDAVGRALVGLHRAGLDLARDRRPLSRFFRGRPPPALRTDSRRA